MSLIGLMKARRSRYALTDKLAISDEEVEHLVGEVLKQTPSAFNMQSARVIILFGDKHRALWSIVKETLRACVPADKFAPTEQKINAFAAAHGTVLYWNDEEVVKKFQGQYATYADNFPVWSQQSNGMLQFAVWTALAERGVGASLQHYNPLIDTAVKEKLRVPAHWKLIAQMPFGEFVGTDAEKTYVPLPERLRIEK